MGFNVLGYQSHLLQRCHPACGHEGSSHLSPVLTLRFFYRDASSALLQLVNQWLNGIAKVYPMLIYLSIYINFTTYHRIPLNPLHCMPSHPISSRPDDLQVHTHRVLVDSNGAVPAGEVVEQSVLVPGFFPESHVLVPKTPLRLLPNVV